MKQITTAMLFASLLFSPAWAEESAEIDPSKYDREVLEQMVRGMHERVKQLEAEVERLQDVIREGGHRRSSYVPKPIKPVAQDNGAGNVSTATYPASLRREWMRAAEAKIEALKSRAERFEAQALEKSGGGVLRGSARTDKDHAERLRNEARDLEASKSNYIPELNEIKPGNGGLLGNVIVTEVVTGGAVVRDGKGRMFWLSGATSQAGQSIDFTSRPVIIRRNIRHEGKTLPLIEPL